MNEQIAKIAKQAGLTLSVDQQVAFQRAAELIVLEAVKEAEDDCAGWTDRDQCLVGQVMDRIKKHFGVEE